MRFVACLSATVTAMALGSCGARQTESTESRMVQTDWAQQRAEMVRAQLRGRDIVDPRVLDAMNRVERHLFVPDYARMGSYDDSPLPIGQGQTISQPYIVAFM